MRPRGEVSEALVRAAQAGPAPVRELAARAGVGYSVARYTATRLVDRGELVVLHGGRPAVLAALPAAARDATQQADEAHALDLLADMLRAIAHA